MSCNGECSVTRGQEEYIKELQERLAKAQDILRDNCVSYPDGCIVCSPDYIHTKTACLTYQIMEALGGSSLSAEDRNPILPDKSLHRTFPDGEVKS